MNQEAGTLDADRANSGAATPTASGNEVDGRSGSDSRQITGAFE